MNPPNCIVCQKQMQPAMAGECILPTRGTIFTAAGNYGSTVFDPMQSDVSLTIVICDGCLPERKAHVVYTTESTAPTTYDYKPWQG